eukprot:365104-Chlamydomonas_euryale.AAC.9
MTRLQIRMPSYPRWAEPVEVETFFAEDGRIGARRDWVVRSGSTSAQLGTATSTWVNINISTRRLVKLDETLRSSLLEFAAPKEL